jgi:tetratricopeptide (TPR) repeat protein
MGLALLVTLQLAVVSPPEPCSPAHIAVAEQAEQRLLRGDDDGASRELSAAAAADECRLLRLALMALDGWSEARALAPAGGAAELLGPAQRRLDDLQAFRQSDEALEAEYAETAIRAAIAAAQDERPEMELLLTHARDLSERLQLRGRRAVWPRPLNLLAGELWFEVDRFEDARAAYERAASVEPPAAALVGLARAQARLGQHAAACATYKRATAAAPALRALAARDLARCR